MDDREALDFAGRTVLVTGSGRNIGRQIVLDFAERGANVVINARANEAEALATLGATSVDDFGTLCPGIVSRLPAIMP